MPAALEQLADRLDLADALRRGKDAMFTPQDLPGRYGRVVAAVDRVLAAIGCQGVSAGGWAVWRHGYVGRVTVNVDIVLAADRVDEFLSVASVSGFHVLKQQPGRWPKLQHKETDVNVDILPEGQRPGTAAHPAPTTIPHPSGLGGGGPALCYIELPALVELKLAAGRARDHADIVELLRANPAAIGEIRRHLAGVHNEYMLEFERLAKRAEEEEER